jgi:hypothetical protein
MRGDRRSSSPPQRRELRAIRFIDRALATFDEATPPVYVEGLAPAEPAILCEFEQTPFFELVRVHAVIGCLTLPERGGNLDFS